MDINKIGENIRIARTIRGYSQEGLANALGKSQNWLQKVEKGEIDLSVNNISAISNELGVQPEFLLFSTPQQVFNNCKQSGTFNNCVINSENLVEKLSKILSKIESKL